MSASLSTGNKLTADQNRHWHELAVLLRRSPVAGVQLLHGIPAGMPPPRRTLTEILATARRQGVTELLAKHLLAGLLLTPGELRRQWPQDIIDELAVCFPGDVDAATAPALSWQQVPILVVQGRRTGVVRMLLAKTAPGTGCRCLLPPAPDASTTTVIHAAIRLADPAGHDFLYWFLQAGQESSVHGPSLALPVALAVRLRRQSRPWPAGLFATGELAPGGSLAPVAHIPEKYATAQAHGCRLFLMPADGSVRDRSHGNRLGCATFADAWFSVELYAGGAAPDMVALYQACQYSFRELLAHFHHLPLSILKSDTCGDLLQQAVKDPRQSMKSLADCLWRCSHDHARAAILANLFSPADVVQMAEYFQEMPDFVFEVFNWCLAQAGYANHRGNIHASSVWTGLAARMRSQVEAGETGRLVTHSLVAERFNRFDFRPELPDAFCDALALAERLQAVYPQSSYLLGAMYGTMAQNFGFCGPDFLDNLSESAARAERAFGRKYCRESKRLDNYRIYALLDSGRLAEAAELLPGYLDLEPGAGPDAWFAAACMMLGPPERADVFRAALVFRLLADVGYRPEPAKWLPSVPLILEQVSHPWQFLGLNLGRMLIGADRPGEAKKLFRHAVRICGAGGETMRPMALLPLAELHAAGLAGPQEYDKTGKIVQGLAAESALNSAHFRSLFDEPEPGGLLDLVRQQRALLFPFSYR